MCTLSLCRTALLMAFVYIEILIIKKKHFQPQPYMECIVSATSSQSITDQDCYSPLQLRGLPFEIIFQWLWKFRVLFTVMGNWV